MAKIPPVNPGDSITAALQNALIANHNANEVLLGDGRFIQVVNIPNGKLISYVGPPIVASPLMPVTLLQTGGSQGTSTAANTYTYTVTATISGIELETAYSPISPGVWRRSFGQVAAATDGLAWVDSDGDLIVTWINEVPTSEECTT